MDATRFDALARLLVASSARRALLPRVVALALGLGGPRLPDAVQARKRGKRRKRKKLKRNAFGCVDVGKPCLGKDKVCCSGICQGRKPKKGRKDKRTCAAHDEDLCIKGQNLAGCGGQQTVHCTTTSGDIGACRSTTGNAGYCSGDGQCRQCARDADCRPFCGPRAACVLCDSPLCPGGTFCAGPIDDDCTFPPA